LTGKSAQEGRVLLAELDRMVAERPTADPMELEIMACNRALLLLALDEPDPAFSVLSGIQPFQRFDRVAAYSAVALQRMGRASEAKAAVNDAEMRYGQTDTLELAKAYLNIGTVSAPAAQATFDEKSRQAMQAMLSEFVNLDQSAQAQVLLRDSARLDTLLIGDVREVSASLMNLVPSSSRISSKMHEDDTTAYLQELLQQRYHMRKWAVLDQSRGGFSAKGRAGKRDLIIKRGALRKH
jgi:hypothetical protein